MTGARFMPCLAAVAVLAGCGEAPGVKADAERGAKLHEVCLDCHGTGPYRSAERKVKSLEALRKEVVRWGDYYSPAMSEQDVADVVAYLDRDFYKFGN